MSGRSTPSNTKHLEERMEGTCGCQGCGEGIPWEPWDGVAQGQDGIQPGDPEGEGSSSHELGTPRVRCPCCGFGFPNGQEFPGKVRDAGQQDWQLSTGRATREKKPETDPGGIPLSCSQGKSAGAGGISSGNVWVSRIHSIRQQGSPRLLHNCHLPAGRSRAQGGPPEPDLYSLLENNSWEVRPKGFGTGFGAKIHVRISWGEHLFHGNHAEG